jgi:hypothetical protein
MGKKELTAGKVSMYLALYSIGQNEICIYAIKISRSPATLYKPFG